MPKKKKTIYEDETQTVLNKNKLYILHFSGEKFMYRKKSLNFQHYYFDPLYKYKMFL